MSTAVIDLDVLRKVHLFAGLGDRDLEAIASRARLIHHNAGDRIIAEGEPGVGLHIVLAGRALVTVGDQSRRTVGPGGYFGEISLIDGRPRTATVRAETPMTTMSITAWDFGPLLDERPQMTRALLLAMCERVRGLEALLAAG